MSACTTEPITHKSTIVIHQNTNRLIKIINPIDVKVFKESRAAVIKGFYCEIANM